MMKSLNFQQAKHLVERAGLGPELDRIKAIQNKSLDSAVEKIINTEIKQQIPPPVFLKPAEFRALRKNGEKQKAKQIYRKERQQLQIWGLENLLKSDHSLHERMVWFWHNHFTSSIRKVRVTEWMYQQDATIRQYALGNFSDLLKAMAFDPAMLKYLDGQSNKKDQPNENFARELLELFTLGEGYYSEQDIKQVARAFTGWKVNIRKNRAMLQRKHHDSGHKQFMEHQGNLSAEDILDILLAQSRTAEFICQKLWYEFISIETPEPEVIKQWAKVFRTSGYQMSAVLKAIFHSDVFWHNRYRGTLIKSPIDLVIGSLRIFDMEDGELPRNLLIKQLKRMGQNLYAPPNVKGWAGGKGWIDDVTLPIRQQFINRLMRGQTGLKNNKRMEKMAMTRKLTMPSPQYPDLSAQQLELWLLALPAINQQLSELQQPQAKVRALLQDPVFQLK